MKFLNKSIVLASCMSVSVVAIAAVGWNPMVTTQTFNTQEQASSTAIKGQITGMSTTYTQTLNSNTSKLVEALRLATSQEALTTTQIAVADRNAKQVFASAYLADQQAEEQLKAFMNFNSATGQGYAACKVYAENNQLSQVVDTVTTQAGGKVQELDNSPGVIVKDKVSNNEMRQAIHNDNFCTPEEQEANTCTVKHGGAVAGADSDANTLFVSSKKGSTISFAKTAVRQNILGAPIESIPASTAKSAMGQGYLLSANHKTALAAFPAYSLAYIESMSEVRDEIKDANGNPMSPNDMLFNTVARYYGGADSVEWQKSMIQQQPRGLLVELAKIEGLSSWLDYQEFQANQRIEGNLAAMTLVNVLPMEKKLNDQQIVLQQASIKDRILRNQ